MYGACRPGPGEAVDGPRLVAIGGGGFTHGTDPELEDFLLALCPAGRPRIGYVGAANRDDPIRTRLFYERFGETAGYLSHLPRDTSAAAASAWVATLDLVYFAGGNTARLIDDWTARGLHRVFLEAARRGVLLAGVSAGACCWFEQVFSDSRGDGFAVIDGFALFPGSCCPHFSSEPGRREPYARHVAAGAIFPGIVIDDGAAVLLQGEVALGAFSARGGGASRVFADRGVAKCEPLPALAMR